MRVFFHIAYNGSNYSGWQYQPNSFSIQEVLEGRLSKIFKRKITVFGCGRTDKGVHASQYFFHIEIIKELPHDFEFILNKHLPSSITLFEIICFKDKEHSRYDALTRTYDYFMHTKSDPYLDNYSTLITDGDVLDFDKMKAAADLVKEHYDFRGLCLQPNSHNNTLCKIVDSKLYVDLKENRLRFSISSNRFLKGMIRVLVSNLIKVGDGSLTLTHFKKYMDNSEISPSHKPAPPNGLYLSRVEYEYLKRKNESLFFSKLVLGLDY